MYRYPDLPSKVHTYSMQGMTSKYFWLNSHYAYELELKNAGCDSPSTADGYKKCLLSEAGSEHGNNAESISKSKISNVQAFKWALGCYMPWDINFSKNANEDRGSYNEFQNVTVFWESALALARREFSMSSGHVCTCMDDVQEAYMMTAENNRDNVKFNQVMKLVGLDQSVSSSANVISNLDFMDARLEEVYPKIKSYFAEADPTLDASFDETQPLAAIYQGVWAYYTNHRTADSVSEFKKATKDYIKSNVKITNFPLEDPLSHARKVYNFCSASSVTPYTMKNESKLPAQDHLLTALVLFVLYGIHTVMSLDASDYGKTADDMKALITLTGANTVKLFRSYGIPVIALGLWIAIELIHRAEDTEIFRSYNITLLIVWFLSTSAMLFALNRGLAIEYTLYKALSTELLLVAAIFNFSLHIVGSSNLHDVDSITAYSGAVLALGGVYIVMYLLAQHLKLKEQKEYKFSYTLASSSEAGFNYNVQVGGQADIVETNMTEEDYDYRVNLRHVVRLRTTLAVLLFVGIILMAVYEWHSFTMPDERNVGDKRTEYSDSFSIFMWNMNFLRQVKFTTYIFITFLLFLGFEFIFELFNAGTLIRPPTHGFEGELKEMNTKKLFHRQLSGDQPLLDQSLSFMNRVSRQDQPLLQNIFLILFFVILFVTETLVENNMTRHEIIVGKNDLNVLDASNITHVFAM